MEREQFDSLIKEVIDYDFMPKLEIFKQISDFNRSDYEFFSSYIRNHPILPFDTRERLTYFVDMACFHFIEEDR